MNYKIRAFSGFVSILVMSSFCLLQSHSYALAEVTTPELPIVVKALKNFSVIGVVREINSTNIIVEKANGSDGAKGMSYVVGYHSPIVENQLYENLSISDVSIGDRIIVQGGIDNSNNNLSGAIVAKRIIVFSNKIVSDIVLEMDTASSTASSTANSTASSTDKINTSTSTEDVSSENSTTTVVLKDGDRLVAPEEGDATYATASSSSELATTSDATETATTSLDNNISTSTEGSIEDNIIESLEKTENPSSTTTTPNVDGNTNPNDKNKDTTPPKKDPDPVDSNSPIISTPIREDNVVTPECLPEPEPEPELNPVPDSPTPEIISVPESSVLPTVDLTPLL